MGKNGRRTEGSIGEKLKSKMPSRFWLAGVVVVVSFLLSLFFFSSPSKPWSLPAIPRNPRPATLSSDLFTGKVREVYRIAREVPELLERMPCYCGCYTSDQHRNNLDCYTDRHSVG